MQFCSVNFVHFVLWFCKQHRVSWAGGLDNTAYLSFIYEQNKTLGPPENAGKGENQVDIKIKVVKGIKVKYIGVV